MRALHETAGILAAILLDWSEAALVGPTIVGGKGAQLARLSRYGLPVPDGCVISVDAYHELMRGELHAAALHACMGEPEGRDAALERVRETIMCEPLPATVSAALDMHLSRKGWGDIALAVRSSAPTEDSAQASFAGIHRSVLNVVGRSALDDAIRTVWASLWTPQAVAYRERMHIAHGDAAMAVVLMPMVAAQASGVIFTSDPNTGREDRIVISSVRGLGEALVSGMVAGEDVTLGCDFIGSRLKVVGRRAAHTAIALEAAPEGGVRQRTLTSQEQAEPILDDAQAIALGELARDAAHALDYTTPWYDIEWVWDGAGFQLVQARPITQRAWYTYPALQSQGAIWTNGNTRDVLPYVLDPFDIQILPNGANALLETPGRLAGYPLLPGAQRAKAIKGRAYLNASLIQWEAFDAFGLEPRAMNRMLGGHQPEISLLPQNWRHKFRHNLAKFRLLRAAPAERRRGLTEARRVRDTMRKLRMRDLRSADDVFLIAQYEGMAGVHYRYPGLCMLQSFNGGMMELINRLEQIFPGESNSIAAALLAGGDPSVTAQQGYDLISLAQIARNDPKAMQWLLNEKQPSDFNALPQDSAFRRALSTFLDEYGHRGVYESYLRMPRLRETPDFLRNAIAGLLDVSLDDIRERQQKSAETAWKRIASATKWTERLTIRLLQRMAKTESNHRELARSTFMLIADWGRRIMLEIGHRLEDRKILERCDDVFHLTTDEQSQALRGLLPRDAIRARVAARVEMVRQWESEEPPEVIISGAAVYNSTVSPISKNADRWQGVAIGCGKVEGKVRIIRNPHEQSNMQPGDILVAPSTDPSWVPLFLKAGGLIMETGGFLSHGAIVAREFGIPAVVNVPGIMDVLRDGESVVVDGDRGLIIRLELRIP